MPWKDSGADREWNDDELAETVRTARRPSMLPPGGNGTKVQWIVAGVVIALLAANLAVMIVGDIRQERRLTPLALRVQALESRIDQLDTQEQTTADIRQQWPEITDKAHRMDLFMGRFERLESMVAKRFGDLSDRLHTVEGRLDALRSTPAAKKVSESRPPASHSPASSTTAATHTVAKGETLFHIARLYHTTVSELQRLNGLSKSTAIHPGQILKIR